MQSVGTKIPPGGGGSRWAKIVSGSYDETVIVWKRDSEGKWQVKLRLHQDQLLRAHRASRRREHFAAAANGGPNNAAQAQQGDAPANGGNNANQPGQILNTAQTHLQQVHNLLQHQQYLGGAAPAQGVHLPTMANAQDNLNGQLNTPPIQQQQHQQHHTTVTTTTSGPTTTVTATTPQTQTHQHQHQHQHHHHPNHQQPLYPPVIPGGAPHNIPPHLQPQPLPPNPNPGQPQIIPANSLAPQIIAQLNAQAAQHTAQLAAQQQQQQQPQQNPNQQQQQQPHNPNWPGSSIAAAAPANGHGAGGRVQNESNRVFKLQFDARRIVCCSQNRTIVGWDFANGDEELERLGEWSLETA